MGLISTALKYQAVTILSNIYRSLYDFFEIFWENPGNSVWKYFLNLELFSADRKEGSGESHQLDQGEKNSDHRFNNEKGSLIMAKHE